MKNRRYYTYITTNGRHTVLYVGMTNNIRRRIWEHKNKVNLFSFSAQYNVDKLVYFEEYPTRHEALARESQLKAGPRWRKEKLINENNPRWEDLGEYLLV